MNLSHSNSNSHSHSGHHAQNQPKPYSFLNKSSIITGQSGSGGHSVRSVSTSPLAGDRGNGAPLQLATAHNSNTNGNRSGNGNGISGLIPDTSIPDLAPITELHHPVVHSVGSGGGRNRNVFSRLTNPRHFVSTSRTRAQELQNLKEKVRKQKESHSHIQQKKASWKRQKMAHSPDPQPPVSALLPRDHHNPHPHHHPTGMDQSGLLHDDDDPNKSVFMRLHNTNIRNTRTHLNSSLNGEEAMMLMHDDHNLSGIGGAGFLMNEPARIVNQHEISKKPQRNPNANATKSLLTQPARVLTPDDL